MGVYLSRNFNIKNHGISPSLNLLPISAPTTNVETIPEGRYAKTNFVDFVGFDFHPKSRRVEARCFASLESLKFKVTSFSIETSALCFAYTILD